MSLTSVVRSVDVRGADRPMFFKRPLVPFLRALTNQDLLLSTQNVNPLVPPTPRPPSPPTRSIGLMTDYREADIQTDPFTPDYVIKSENEPEVLTLTSLTYNKGLPAGKAEVELIINARKRRALEQSLPKDFKQCIKILSQRDAEDWNQRELAIKRVQDAEIDQLEAQLYQRNLDSEHLIQTRTEAFKRDRARILVEKFASKRNRTRSFAPKITPTPPSPCPRANVELSSDVSEFFNESSFAINFKKEADKARVASLKKGRGLGSIKDKKIIDALDLALTNNKSVSRTAVKTSITREDLAMVRRPLTPALKSLPKSLSDRNFAADVDSEPEEDPSIAFGSVENGRIAMRARRQELRRLRDDYEEQQVSVERSAVMLQALIRGRAAQIKLVKSLENKKALIAECRATQALGVVVNELKARNDDMRAQRIKETVEKAQKDQKLGQIFGSKLDHFAKELERKREQKKILDFINVAVIERNKREEVERERRKKEEEILKERETLYKEVRKVHKRSARLFVDDLISSVVNSDEYISLASIPPALPQGAGLVASLLHCNIVPSVEEALLRERIQFEQRKIKIAVSGAIKKTFFSK
ncbi:hypothetical protein RCL1_004263 [Eukaryota sp. TZLM3-RCL]